MKTTFKKETKVNLSTHKSLIKINALMKTKIYSNETPQETIAIPTYTRRLPNSIQTQIHDSVNFAQVRRSKKILIQNSPKAPTPSLSSIEEANTQTMN